MAGSDLEYVSLPIYQDGLASALDFTPSDLSENQAGRLGTTQRATLDRVIAGYAVKSIIFGALAGAAAAWALAIGIGTDAGFRILLVAVALLLFVGFFVRSGLPLWRDVRAGTVSNIAGMVRPAERETDVRTGSGRRTPFSSYYWIVDESQRFSVPGNAYVALTPARHRLYFLPLSRRIVAAEPISNRAS